MLTARLFASFSESDNRACDFGIGKGVRLSRFRYHRLHKISTSFFDPTRDSLQQVATSVRRFCAGDCKRLMRNFDRFVDRF